MSPHFFARLYLLPATATTSNSCKRLPMLIYFHDACFVMGSVGSIAYHRCLNNLATVCPVVAISADSRLAPEHSVPTVYEDSLASGCYLPPTRGSPRTTTRHMCSWMGTVREATSTTTLPRTRTSTTVQSRATTSSRALCSSSRGSGTRRQRPHRPPRGARTSWGCRHGAIPWKHDGEDTLARCRSI